MASPATAARPGQRVLRARMWLPRPVPEVWPYFADAHNLEELTPPFLRFHVKTPAPIAMHVDTRIDYRLRIHGVPIGWRTRIARWEPPYAFADEQLRDFVIEVLRRQLGDAPHEPLFRSFPHGIPRNTLELWFTKVLLHFLQTDTAQPCLTCEPW